MTPPDQPAVNVVAVAKGLTKAQREVMLSMRQDSVRHAPYHRYRPRMNSLQSVFAMAHRGIIARADDGVSWDFYETGGRIARTGMAVLTPLGLAVRAHLLKQDS